MITTMTKSRLEFISIPRSQHSIYIKCGNDYWEANNFQNEIVSKGLATFKNSKYQITEKGKQYIEKL